MDEDLAELFAAVKPFTTGIEAMRHYDLTSVRWSR